MADTLWRFWTYSFLGYLLERAFAAVTRDPWQERKCFLLLPLCPVYGLGVLAVLALPGILTAPLWLLALWGGFAATIVEYAVHLAYDKLLHVRFWDYSRLPGNLRGRICPAFSAAWAVLIAAALPLCEAVLTPLIAAIPAWVTYWTLLLFTADAVISARLLRAAEDIRVLTLHRA